MPVAPSPSASRADPLIGRAVTHYRIDERLGGGGMGVVYRAHDLTLERDVALKFLPAHLHADAVARDQLVREAKAASALDDPNVATVYEIGQAEDGRLFIAMACYRGETLKKKAAAGPLPVDEAVGYVRQAAAGLDHAHRAGIVHRDVKPANLIVTDRGRVKVLDFGVASSGAEAAAAGVSGTAAYMSPEQARGHPTDARTDVWGLGATLYELLAGRRAFDGAFPAAILYAVQHEAPTPLPELRPDLPEGLAEVVGRCLAKDPDARYPSAEALREALAPFEAAPTPIDVPAFGRLRVRLRALPVAARAALAGAAVLAAGGLAVWGGGGPTVQHLAVLPFEAIGGGPEAEAFTAGLLETVTGRLSQLEQFDGALLVVPASEIEPGMTPSDARARFGATMVVDGTVQVAGDRVRLVLNLIDTAERRQVASEQVDYDAASPLAVQDQAVLRLAQMLEVEVAPAARDALTAGGTASAEANALYLRGRGALRDAQTPAAVRGAVRLLRQALGLDAEFALAHAALGQALWELYGETDDPALAAQAEAAVERAVALDPSAAPVYVALAEIRAGRQEPERALDALDRAEEIDPRNAEAVRRRAIVLRNLGRADEAEAAYYRAIALRPTAWWAYSSLGVFYYLNGDLQEAIETYRQGLAQAPSNLSLLNNLGAAYWDSGRLREAAETFERILDAEPDHPFATTNLATARFYLGQTAEAAALYERLLADAPDRYETRQYLGDALYWTPGRRTEAQAAYRRAVGGARANLAVGRSQEAVGTLAGAFARLGVADSARAYLAELVDGRAPGELDPYLALDVGTTFEILGDRPAARRWIESALGRGIGHVELEHSPWLAGYRSSVPS